MKQSAPIAAALVLISSGGPCSAQSDTSLHIPRAVLKPKTGAVTVEGTVDCLTSERNGPVDVIATLRQDPIGPKTRSDEFPGATGIGSAVTETCRDREIRNWSMVVQSLSSRPFGPGSKAHLMVSSLPNDPGNVGAALVSAEADVSL